MFKKFLPINSNVLVELVPNKETTSSGLYIPSEAQQANQTAKVICPGNSTVLKIDDIVYYQKYMGIKLDDTYLVLKEDQILGVMNHG